MNFPAWFSGVLGNAPKVRILIFAFIFLLVLLAVRCARASDVEAHLQAGVAFGCLQNAPVLGLELRQQIAEGMAWDAGTTLWGNTARAGNNFDFHARIEFSRGPFGVGIGPAYLQNIDYANGSHLEFSLLIFWNPFPRVGGKLIHLSDAGTTPVNCGRNAAIGDWQMR